jgi:hypothetical protein
MHKFTTEIVEEIKAKEIVEQLVINNIKVLEQFEKDLSGTTYSTELRSLLLYIQHLANGGSVGKKTKIIKGNKDSVMEYEFISKHLRVYAIQQPNKKIIIYGGVKRLADSSDNIAAFRLVKKEYLDFLKTIK